MLLTNFQRRLAYIYRFVKRIRNNLITSITEYFWQEWRRRNVESWNDNLGKFGY